MTDEEVSAYLETIGPVYTELMRQHLDAIEAELNGNEERQKCINLKLNSQPPFEVDCEAAWEKELLWREELHEQNDAITNEYQRLRVRKHVFLYHAEREGINQRIKELRDKKPDTFHEIQLQGTLLLILDNKSAQLDEVIKLLGAADSLESYELSYGEVGDLRGSWDEAVDAVTVTWSDSECLDEERYADTNPAAILPRKPRSREGGGKWYEEIIKALNKYEAAHHKTPTCYQLWDALLSEEYITNEKRSGLERALCLVNEAPLGWKSFKGRYDRIYPSKKQQ